MLADNNPLRIPPNYVHIYVEKKRSLRSVTHYALHNYVNKELLNKF